MQKGPSGSTQKDKADALRGSPHFAQTILDSVGEGIVVYDRNFRYLVWNSFMENITGLSADEIIGKSALDTFPHLRQYKIDRLLKAALAGETVTTPEVPYTVPKTGIQGWAISVYQPTHHAKWRNRRCCGLHS